MAKPLRKTNSEHRDACQQRVGNPSGTTGQIAEEAAESTEAKQTSFHSRARVTVDNRAALDALLRRKLLVTFASGAAETRLEGISQDGTNTDPSNELLSWLSAGMSNVFPVCFTENYYFHNMCLSVFSCQSDHNTSPLLNVYTTVQRG